MNDKNRERTFNIAMIVAGAALVWGITTNLDSGCTGLYKRYVKQIFSQDTTKTDTSYIRKNYESLKK